MLSEKLQKAFDQLKAALDELDRVVEEELEAAQQERAVEEVPE